MSKKKILYAAAIILLVVAAFLRLYRLGEFVTFLGDQGRDAMILRDILTFKHFPAIGAPSSIGGVYLGPFYYYFIAPFLLFSNFNPIGPAYGVALTSIIGLVAGYFVIKKDIETTTALFFVVLSTFCYALIELARFSWNPNLLPVFAFFTLYFFYKTLQTNKWQFAIAFGAFLSFSIQLHYLAISLFIPILIVLIEHIILHRKKLTQTFFVNAGLALLTFAFFSSPLLVFDLKHQFLNTNNFIKMFTENKVIGGSSFPVRLVETFQFFLQHTYRTSFTSTTTIEILIITATLLSAVLAQKKLPQLIKLHTWNVVGFMLFFSLLSSPRHIHYYGTVYLSYFLVTAYFFASLYLSPTDYKFKKFSHKTAKILSHILSYAKYAITLLFFIAFLAINMKQYYFLYGKGGSQIAHAKTVAESFNGKISTKNGSIQLVTEPHTETDGHFRYYLKLNGYTVLPAESPEQPKEMFLLCFQPQCEVLGNSQWQIASFAVVPPTIETTWTVEGVTIYKLVHK